MVKVRDFLALIFLFAEITLINTGLQSGEPRERTNLKPFKRFPVSDQQPEHRAKATVLMRKATSFKLNHD